MEYTNSYIEDEDEEELFQQTTNEESIMNSLAETKFKKWLNSDTDISNISSIYRLELENLNEKNSDITYENKEENKKKEYKKSRDKKNKNNSEEDNNEKVDNFSEKEKKERNGQDNISKDTFKVSNNIKKNYTFIWNEGGNDVKITGSFSNWKIQYKMTKDPIDNNFKCELPLENKIYQYKFIVDNVWKYSKNFPFINDGNGNINNIIDCTKSNLLQSKDKENLIKKNKKEKEKEKINKIKKKQKSSRASTNKTKTRDSSKKKSKKIIKKNSIYQSKFPSDEGVLPLPLPNERYFKPFNFEKYSKQNSIGNKKYFEYYDRYYFSNLSSSKPIFILGHIHLNHLISPNHSKKDILKNSMSFRYREKDSTFIYYKYKYK